MKYSTQEFLLWLCYKATNGGHEPPAALIQSPPVGQNAEANAKRLVKLVGEQHRLQLAQAIIRSPAMFGQSFFRSTCCMQAASLLSAHTLIAYIDTLSTLNSAAPARTTAPLLCKLHSGAESHQQEQQVPRFYAQRRRDAPPPPSRSTSTTWCDHVFEYVEPGEEVLVLAGEEAGSDDEEHLMSWSLSDADEEGWAGSGVEEEVEGGEGRITVLHYNADGQGQSLFNLLRKLYLTAVKEEKRGHGGGGVVLSVVDLRLQEKHVKCFMAKQGVQQWPAPPRHSSEVDGGGAGTSRHQVLSYVYKPPLQGMAGKKRRAYCVK